MAKVTQRDRILQYLQDFGSITSYEAYTEMLNYINQLTIKGVNYGN